MISSGTFTKTYFHHIEYKIFMLQIKLWIKISNSGSVFLVNGNRIYGISASFHLLTYYKCCFGLNAIWKIFVQQIQAVIVAVVMRQHRWLKKISTETFMQTLIMSAKAVLVAKINSNPFEDRVLLLDVPVKIGRSHKDDQVQY